jgi:hypothetical protein
MTPTATGDSVLRLLRGSSEEVVLVAPFVKVGALSRLLTALAPEASVLLITRWRPEEVRSGVSDVEVFDLVTERRGGAVRLMNNLHAKYYRAGSRILIGSANISDAAMGWGRSPSVELLVEMSGASCWVEFEDRLRRSSVLATASLRDYVRAAALAITLPPSMEYVEYSESGAAAVCGDQSLWIPESRSPEGLWSAYSSGLHSLASAARATASRDLRALDLPLGLQRAAFNRYVGSILLQSVHMAQLDEMLLVSGRFGALRHAISSHRTYAHSGRTPTEILQTSIRWLLHFCPMQFEVRVANFSETLVRRDEAGRQEFD